MSMSMREMIEFVFLNNAEKKPVQLNLHGTRIQNANDLFYFCVDVFSKGLICLYGTEGSFEIDTLTTPQLNNALERLRCLGILVQVTSVRLQPDNPNAWKPVDVVMRFAGHSLSDYKLRIISQGICHLLTFDIKVPDDVSDNKTFYAQQCHRPR